MVGVRGTRQGLTHHFDISGYWWKFSSSGSYWGRVDRVSISLTSHHLIPPLHGNLGWKLRRGVQKPECWLALLHTASFDLLAADGCRSSALHYTPLTPGVRKVSCYLQLTLFCPVSVMLDEGGDSAHQQTRPNTVIWPPTLHRQWFVQERAEINSRELSIVTLWKELGNIGVSRDPLSLCAELEVSGR